MGTDYLMTLIPILGAIVVISLSELKAYYYSIVDRNRHKLPSLSFWNYFLIVDSNRLIHHILFLKNRYNDPTEITRLIKKHNLLYISLLFIYLLILLSRIIPFELT